MLAPTRAYPFAILVVDDSPTVLSLLLGYLRAFGVAAYGASGAAQAEQVLREHSGQIGGALIDFYMPDADGVETRRRLERINPGLRCALMSGAGLSGGEPPEGFSYVLDKPFGQAQLHLCLDALWPRELVEGRVG